MRRLSCVRASLRGGSGCVRVDLWRFDCGYAAAEPLLQSSSAGKWPPCGFCRVASTSRRKQAPSRWRNRRKGAGGGSPAATSTAARSSLGSAAPAAAEALPRPSDSGNRRPFPVGPLEVKAPAFKYNCFAIIANPSTPFPPEEVTPLRALLERRVGLKNIDVIATTRSK